MWKARDPGGQSLNALAKTLCTPMLADQGGPMFLRGSAVAGFYRGSPGLGDKEPVHWGYFFLDCDSTVPSERSNCQDLVSRAQTVRRAQQ